MSVFQYSAILKSNDCNEQLEQNLTAHLLLQLH